MTLYKRIALLCLLLAGVQMEAAAQRVLAVLRQQVNPAGTDLLIDVRINSNSAVRTVPGLFDFRFAIDTATLNINQLTTVQQGRWSNDGSRGGDGGQYKSVSVRVGPDNASIVARIRPVSTNITNSFRALVAQQFASPRTRVADSLSLVVRISLPIKNCSRLTGVQWIPHTQTGGGNAATAEGTLLQPSDVGFNYEYQGSAVPAVPARNSVATPTLTCSSLPQGVRFRWGRINNATRIVFTLESPGGNVRTTLTATDSVIVIPRAVGQAARGFVTVYGSCPADSIISAATTCSAIACPTLVAPTATTTLLNNTVCPLNDVAVTIVRSGNLLSMVRPLQYSFDGGTTYGPDSVLTLRNVGGGSTNPDTTVTFTIRDANACVTPVGNLTLTIRRLNDPNSRLEISDKAGLSSTIFCNNAVVPLTGGIVPDASAEPGLDFTWSTSGTGVITGVSTTQVNYNPAAGETGQVTFYLRNQCFRLVDSVTVTIEESPQVDLRFVRDIVNTNTGDTAFVGQPVTLTLPAGLTIGTTYTIDWGDGQNEPVTGATFSHVYNTANTYTARLIAQSGPCSGTDQVVIKVVNLQAAYVPNVLAPGLSNQDNNSLRIYGVGVQSTDFKFLVFDRWGNVVYETSSLDQARNVGWNGKRNNSGDLLPSGVYTYGLKGKYLDNSSFEQTGNVTLLK